MERIEKVANLRMCGKFCRGDRTTGGALLVKFLLAVCQFIELSIVPDSVEVPSNVKERLMWYAVSENLVMTQTTWRAIECSLWTQTARCGWSYQAAGQCEYAGVFRTPSRYDRDWATVYRVHTRLPGFADHDNKGNFINVITVFYNSVVNKRL